VVLATVAAASSARGTPAARATTAAVWVTNAGSLRLPRIGTGDRYGQSVSIKMRSTGTPEDATAYAAMGCYVSFSGIVTYKTAGAIRAAVGQVPLDRLLIETDCPYLAPVPMRGRRNEPAFVTHTATVVAAAAGVTVAELAAATVANTARIFRLPAAASAP
jgi:hypothetical protein